MHHRRFLDKTRFMPPSSLLLEALLYLTDGESALDLGAGSGRDTRYLLERGFKVTAVDINPDAIEILRALPCQERLAVVQSTFADFTYGRYDLINARFSLPFQSRHIPFNAMFSRIKEALCEGGILVGQLFGSRDEWNTPAIDMTFHTMDGVQHLLQDLRIISIREEEWDGTTELGTAKHWHLFHVIAQA